MEILRLKYLKPEGAKQKNKQKLEESSSQVVFTSLIPASLVFFCCDFIHCDFEGGWGAREVDVKTKLKLIEAKHVSLSFDTFSPDFSFIQFLVSR